MIFYLFFSLILLHTAIIDYDNNIDFIVKKMKIFSIFLSLIKMFSYNRVVKLVKTNYYSRQAVKKLKHKMSLLLKRDEFRNENIRNSHFEYFNIP